MILVHPKNEEHIINRLQERVGPVAQKWLYEILFLLNEFVPDDWRLGNKGNEFIIRVVGERNATLFGQSLRGAKNPDKIYHVVKTILPPGGFIKELIKDEDRLNSEEARIFASRPNLYLAEMPTKHSFFMVSPVAARQYEKINPNQTNEPKYEFHRVHPLYKTGLDLRNFGWVKWFQNGEIELNVNPESGWHVKSYWLLEGMIDRDEERQINSHYHSSIHRFNIRRF